MFNFMNIIIIGFHLEIHIASETLSCGCCFVFLWAALGWLSCSIGETVL